MDSRAPSPDLYEQSIHGSDMAIQRTRHSQSMGSSSVYEYDPLQDTNMTGNASGERIGMLEKNLLSKGLVCTLDGNVMVYCENSKRWSPLSSKDTQGQLAGWIGASNATVNYGDTILPFVSCIATHAARSNVTSIPTSVCIGMRRFQFSISGKEVKYTQVGSLLSSTSLSGMRDEQKRVISQLCSKPCNYPFVPQLVTVGDYPRMHERMSALFTDQRDLLTLMWCIGNCVIDPIATSKMVILVGPTHTGKSNIVDSITSVINGSSATISTSAVVGDYDSPSQEVMSAMAGSRLVTMGEVNFAKKQPNVHMIKTLVGHDSVPTQPIQTKTACTALVCSNNLPNPIESRDWLTDPIARRVVVIPLHVNAKEIESDDMAEDYRTDSSRFEMLTRCIMTRMKYPEPPVSPRIVLLTILGAHYPTFNNFLEFDEEADVIECTEASTLIANFLSLSLSFLGELARHISRSAVLPCGAFYVIAGIRKISRG